MSILSTTNITKKGVIDTDDFVIPEGIKNVLKKSTKTNKSFNMTHESLETTLKLARKEERKKVIEEIVRSFIAAVSLVLYDHHGFDKEKLEALQDHLDVIFDAMDEEGTCTKDIEKVLLDEIGLDLSCKRR